jgi:hypothetical protein
LIGGVIKYFRFTWDFVVWEISYVNLNMLLATIPVYKSDKKKKEDDDNDDRPGNVEDEENLSDFAF